MSVEKIQQGLQDLQDAMGGSNELILSGFDQMDGAQTKLFEAAELLLQAAGCIAQASEGYNQGVIKVLTGRDQYEQAHAAAAKALFKGSVSPVAAGILHAIQEVPVVADRECAMLSNTTAEMFLGQQDLRRGAEGIKEAANAMPGAHEHSRETIGIAFSGVARAIEGWRI